MIALEYPGKQAKRKLLFFSPCLFVVGLMFVLAGPASAQVFPAGHCHSAIPEEETTGFTPLPQGEIFCALLADPKRVHSFVSVLDGTAANFPSNIGAVGIGDRFGVLRWGAVQLGLAGGVFSQFDLGSPSYDLINADYVIGLPLTIRYRSFSMRVRLYHQSSHLGDEFLLREQPERENLSFESVEALVSQELGLIRLYGGGERLLQPSPEDLSLWLVHGGVELRPGGALFRIDPLGSSRLIGGLDLKFSQEQDWESGLSVRAGLEGSRAEAPSTPIDTWQLVFEYYDGPTPYGQFFRGEMSYWGIGLHFSR